MFVLYLNLSFIVFFLFIEIIFYNLKRNQAEFLKNKLNVINLTFKLNKK